MKTGARTRTGGALVVTALSASLLFACGSEDEGENTSGDAAAPAAESSAAADPRLEQAVDIQDSVPGEEMGDHFVERIWYPTRDHEPDREQNWGDFYMPTGDFDEESVPLVIFIHGGAWHKGAPGVRHIVEDLADRGMAVWNIEYRDVSEGGGWPETFTDVADALDYVPSLNERHPEVSIDDETVVGHSAGAQLAAWAGTRGDLDTDQLGADPKFTPSRVVSLAGPLDLVWAAEHGDQNIVNAMKGTPDELPEQYHSVDPIQNINRHIPVVALHGTDDTTVPPDNSEHYVDAVTRDQGDAKLVMMNGENHISFLDKNSPHYEKVLDAIHRTATHSRDELHNLLDGGTLNLAER